MTCELAENPFRQICTDRTRGLALKSVVGFFMQIN